MAKIVGITELPDMGGAGMIEFDDGRPPMMAERQVIEEVRQKHGIPTAMTEGVAGPGSGARDYAAEDRQDFVDTMKAAGRGLYNAATTPIAGTELSQRSAARLARDPNGQILSAGDSLNNNIDPVSGLTLPPKTRVAGPGDAPIASPAPAPAAPAPAPAAAPPSLLGAPAAPANPDADLDAAMERAMQGSTETTTEGTTRSETTRGAPYTKDAAQARIMAAQEVRDTELSRMRADKLMSDAQAADAAARIPYLKLQQANAEKEVNDRQEYYRQHRAALEKELNDFDEAGAIDPRRFFSGDNAVSAVMSVIGAGLGAAGATLGHTQNYAFDYLQQRIKDDIEAQRVSLQMGHNKRANALGRFVDYYQGDLNQAQTALEIAMKRAALAEVDRFGGQTRSREIAQNIPAFKAKFDQSILKDEQTLYNQAMGTTKYESSSKTQSKSHTPTIEEVAKAYEARHKGDLKPEKEADLIEHYAKAKGDEAAARESLKLLAQQIGATWDQKTQSWVMPKGQTPSVAGFGATSWVPNFLTTEEGRNFRRAYLDVLSNTIKMRSGSSASEGEVERLNKIVAGTYDSDILGGLNQLQRTQDAEGRARDAGYDPKLIDRYNSNKTNIVRNAKTDKAGAPEERIQ